jgi:ADP-ribose pyrophosphatase YjhB (NUDIX family)
LYASATPTASNKAIIMYPRAAAAVTVQYGSHYLLVQRGKPPGQGIWALPGGKMEMGETALEAAQRELHEEVKFDPPLDNYKVQWSSGPFLTSDAIVRDADGVILFHYLIAQCFCRVVPNEFLSSSLPLVSPDDDAADAKWWTLDEIKQNQGSVSLGVVTVIERAELLSEKGALL